MASTPDLDRALELVRFLRANCPWDAKQTASTLIPYLIEETQEVIEAIHAGDDDELEGELGDLLLNLAFQIVVAEERGALTADSVTQRLEAKMRRRHPHLYGDGPQEDWEVIKARERAEQAGGEASGDRPDPGVLDGVTSSLDPLSRAHRVQQRVARVGFDWSSWQGAWDKVAEELDEVRVELETPGRQAALEEELGDLLFAVVNLVRLADAHPVSVLARANHKFERRFRSLEALARERGVRLGDASLAELDELWDELKAAEKASD